MQTQKINTFLFSELTDKIKSKVLIQYADKGTFDWWYESTFENAKENGIKLTGFNIDRGQTIEGEFIWSEIEVAEKIEEEFDSESKIHILASNFLKERLRICDSYEFVDGAPIKEDELEDELVTLENEFVKDVLQQYWIFLRDEYEYLYSDEYLAEFFESNEYQFTENGTLYNF
jgi:hypothetical protein